MGEAILFFQPNPEGGMTVLRQLDLERFLCRKLQVVIQMVVSLVDARLQAPHQAIELLDLVKADAADTPLTVELRRQLNCNTSKIRNAVHPTGMLNPHQSQNSKKH